ncbi:MAG TPA: tetratricopeptide repeat protein, partial [Polyangiaceae bacterium]|nr:tetratricopeptide repeat protein [Polyangiaceae bacterium]
MSSISPKADNPKAEVRRRPASALATKLWEITQALEEHLADPRDVLETLVSSVAKGEPAEATWELLHRAASRDKKVSELAQEYEQIAHDKRIKLLAPEQQAFIFRQAAEFFSSVYGDADLAVGYAERAYTVAPESEGTFALLESLLTGTGRLARLARLYAESAERSADHEAKRLLLGRAFGIAGVLDDGDELVIDTGRRILEIAPEEDSVRDAVMQRLIAAGRHADVVDLLEKALAREPAPAPEEARLHREQLIDLCFTVLQSPERALTHLEGLLALDPTHEMARKAAEGMLEHKQLMPRAAAALSDAYQAAGELDRAVSMLTFELKHVRGPRRVEVQRRLAILRQDVLGDVSGALELLGPVVAGDPGDDALRQRYVALSLALNQPDQAARLLSRALSTHRDSGVRARVGVDVGNVYVRSGDLKRAHLAFSKVLESSADPGASLEAARRMADLFSDTLDSAELARVLETIVRLEPERETRQAAARRLARLADGELGDAERAIVAWRALVGSPWTDEALSRLDALYEQAGDQLGLSDVLAFRAERTRDPVEARELAVRALELRTAGARDSEASIAAYQSFAERFGPSRELHARLVPLLEQTGRFAELAEVLLREIELVQPSERGALWARLGQVRLSRLSDARGALDAFARAFSLDASDRAARAGLERLLAIESTRIAAADLLEPVYRASATPAELLKVLEARAEGESTAEARLAARDEVIYLSENELADPDRALEHAVRALRDALENEPSAAGDWSVVVLRLAPACTSPTRRAELLLWAAGSLDVLSQESFEL